MFFFFSNRLGCAGSLLRSVVLTVIVIAVTEPCEARGRDGVA